MLEDFITKETKNAVLEAYSNMRNKTDAYYTLRTFNIFNNKYNNRHFIETPSIQEFIKYGDRKAEVFKRYAKKAIKAYDTINNQYTINGEK